jgi:tetratricopeptide (TPR) repeat protein
VKKTTIAYLAIGTFVALVLLHFCEEEPGSENSRPSAPRLSAKPFNQDDRRVKDLCAALSKRSETGAKQLKQWQEANFVLQRNPEDIKALYLRTNLLLNFHLLEYALSDANKLIVLEPESARMFFLQGRIYEAASDSPQAIQSYEKAIACTPNFGDALYRRGRLYLESGSPWLAKSDLEKCRTAEFMPAIVPGTVNANSQSILYYLAKAYESTKRYEEAVRTYREYLAFISRHPLKEQIYDDSFEQQEMAEDRLRILLPEVLDR